MLGGSVIVQQCTALNSYCSFVQCINCGKGSGFSGAVSLIERSAHSRCEALLVAVRGDDAGAGVRERWIEMLRVKPWVHLTWRVAAAATFTV